MFQTTRNATKVKITFSAFEQESQKLVLLSVMRWRRLTLKWVGGGGGSCIGRVTSRRLQCVVNFEAVQNYGTLRAKSWRKLVSDFVAIGASQVYLNEEYTVHDHALGHTQFAKRLECTGLAP